MALFKRSSLKLPERAAQETLQTRDSGVSHGTKLDNLSATAYQAVKVSPQLWSPSSHLEDCVEGDWFVTPYIIYELIALED